MSGIQFVKDVTSLAVSREVRENIEFLQQVIGEYEYLPMINPDTDYVEVAQMMSPSTQNLYPVIDEIRSVIFQQLQSNATPCRCAEWYEAYQELMIKITQDIKKVSSREKELAKAQKEVAQKWGEDIPLLFGKSGKAHICEYCHKPYAIPDIIAFSEPTFLQKLISLLIGGDFPLQYLVLYLTKIDKWIYNPDVIPPHEKKAVEAFLNKTKLLEKKNRLFQGTILQPLIGNEVVTSSPTSTATTLKPGDGSPPRWTPDLPPRNDASTTNSTTDDNGNS